MTESVVREVKFDKPSSAPAAAAPDRQRQMRRGTKRMLFVLLGVLVLAVSVAGFYFTSDVFDERARVMVASRPIAAGETLSFTDFGYDEAVVGSIPHLPWTADAPYRFEGMVALVTIPAGTLVRDDMFVAAETVPVGVELETVVPLDLSLATGTLFEGDTVLLIDPGAEPVEGDPGRPRRVVRETELTNFDGTQMQLFVSPEEWAQWESLLAEVGGTLMAMDLGIGADAGETARRLDSVWLGQWSEAVEEADRAAVEAAGTAAAAPGDLEVVVPLDTSLSPSGVVEGDTVLLIDPGAEPLAGDPGRPRTVIGTLRLENYSNGQMRMFAPPEEWLYWQSLPDVLGAAPQVLPITEGTDVNDTVARLNALWRSAWQEAQTATAS
ncbi:MAG: hypothetical protein F4Z64_08945 [Acidimicrobiaceae bacterium]|nr:hypothetical protein [Acidimicrobiaceae bacterium]MYE96481.1 hypothetical protein [Acidimicrobiaceae bacterium]